VSFVLGSGGKCRLHPSAIQMLGGSEFRLRQGFAAQNACTAHQRRRPDGRLGVVLKNPAPFLGFGGKCRLHLSIPLFR
jgi:hypothetical protein